MTVQELIAKLSKQDLNAVVARYTAKGPVLIEEIALEVVDVEGEDADRCVVHRPMIGVVLF